MSIDLGAGANKLTLANVGNTGTVKNSTTITGGTGADTITLAPPSPMVRSTSAPAADTLTFCNVTNSATVSNTETITGGTGNDSLTLAPR